MNHALGDALVAELNKRHAVVREMGKAVVLKEEWDHVLRRHVLRRSSFASFKDQVPYPSSGRQGLYGPPERRSHPLSAKLHVRRSLFQLRHPRLLRKVQFLAGASRHGWSDIGYHYFIRKNGTIEPGRDLEWTPAAQKGNNIGTIAICLHGLAVEKFSRPQFRSVIELCEEINSAYQGTVSFHGHREVSSKSCPVFSYSEVLGLVLGARVQSRLQSLHAWRPAELPGVCRGYG